MNRQDQEDVARVVSDMCGGLVCTSIGFAVFVAAFSLNIEHYSVDEFAVASVAVGIALGGFLARVTLLLSYCETCTRSSVFKPVVIWTVAFCIIGVAAGLGISHSYNTDWRNEMCSSVAAGLEEDPTPYMEAQCPIFMKNVQRFIDSILTIFLLFLICMVVFGCVKPLRPYRSGIDSKSGTPQS